MAADYYELLGVAPRRAAPTRSSGPTGGWPASCIPTPTPTTRGRERVQGGRARPTRRCRDPERRQRYDLFGPDGVGARRPATRSAVRRPRRHLRRVLRRRWQRRSAAAARGPPGRRVAPTSRSSLDLDFEQAVFGAQARVTRAHAPWRATTARAPAPAPGTHADHLRRVRRHRPGAPGAPVDPRPDGHGRPVPALRRAGRGDRQRRARPAAARAARSRSRPTPSTCPPASTTARRCGSPAAARPGPRGGPPATSTSTCGSRPHDRFERDGLRPRRTSCTSR